MKARDRLEEFLANGGAQSPPEFPKDLRMTQVCRACGDPFDPRIGLPDWQLKGMGITFIPPWLRVLCNWCIENIQVDMDEEGNCIGPSVNETHMACYLASQLRHFANRVKQKLPLRRCDALKHPHYTDGAPYRCRSYAYHILDDGHHVCSHCYRAVHKYKRRVAFIDCIPTHWTREIPIMVWAVDKVDFWEQLRAQVPAEWLPEADP